jgi:hypothetical protein
MDLLGSSVITILHGTTEAWLLQQQEAIYMRLRLNGLGHDIDMIGIHYLHMNTCGKGLQNMPRSESREILFEVARFIKTVACKSTTSFMPVQRFMRRHSGQQRFSLPMDKVHMPVLSWQRQHGEASKTRSTWLKFLTRLPINSYRTLLATSILLSVRWRG